MRASIERKVEFRGVHCYVLRWKLRKATTVENILRSRTPVFRDSLNLDHVSALVATPSALVGASGFHRRGSGLWDLRFSRVEAGYLIDLHGNGFEINLASGARRQSGQEQLARLCGAFAREIPALPPRRRR